MLELESALGENLLHAHTLGDDLLLHEVPDEALQGPQVLHQSLGERIAHDSLTHPEHGRVLLVQVIS